MKHKQQLAPAATFLLMLWALPALSATQQQYIDNMLAGSLADDEAVVFENQALLAALPKPEREKTENLPARKLNEAALVLIKAGQFAQASPLLAQAHELSPSDIEIANNYGFTLMKTRDLATAYTVLSHVLSIKPDRAAAWRNLADVIALQGKVDLAAAAYLNVYRFSKDRQKTRQFLQDPKLIEDSPSVHEALAKANTRAATLFFADTPTTTTPANGVRITDTVLQTGTFKIPDCNKDDSVWDLCFCEADIHYPVISGMDNQQAQHRLNQSFKAVAKKAKCAGTALSKAEAEQVSGDESHLSYEVTLQTPAVLALVNQDYSFTAGAAHGHLNNTSYIIELKTGKILSVTDIFGKHGAEINHVIDKAFIETGYGSETLKSRYINAGNCNECTVLLDKEGVKVQFSEYAVAPYSEGTPEVLIPNAYIASPVILDALTAH